MLPFIEFCSMREIMIYYPLYSFIASDIIKQLDEVKSDYTVRMSCPGGEVFPSYGIAKKVKELKAKGYSSTLKIDGLSASMAGVLAPFFDTVEMLKPAKFMIHPPWGGSSNEVLIQVATDLKDILKSRIDEEKFQEITDTTLDDVFDLTRKTRHDDVWLTADQAQEIGLVHKVVELTPDLKNEIENQQKIQYGILNQPPSTMPQSTPRPKLQALLGYTDLEVDEEKGSYLQDSELDTLEKRLSDDATALSDTQKKLQDAETEKASVEAALATALKEAEIEDSDKLTAEEAIQKLSAKIAEYGAAAGASHTPPSGDDDDETKIPEYVNASAYEDINNILN